MLCPQILPLSMLFPVLSSEHESLCVCAMAVSSPPVSIPFLHMQSQQDSFQLCYLRDKVLPCSDFTRGWNLMCVASLRHSTTGLPTGRIYPFSMFIKEIAQAFICM